MTIAVKHQTSVSNQFYVKSCGTCGSKKHLEQGHTRRLVIGISSTTTGVQNGLDTSRLLVQGMTTQASDTA